MGRITVFALASCPHCKAAKALLTNKGWEYYEVSLSDYPEKRPDMLALCDRLTVPQIFLNEMHIGGAAELKALEASGQLEQLYAEMTAKPVPDDPRLQRPDYAPKPEVLASKRTEEAICIGERDCVDFTTLVASLRAGLDIQDRKVGLLTTHKRTFTGFQCTDFLVQEYKLRSRAEAVQVGNSLMTSQVFHHVDRLRGFEDSQDALYRLEADESPLVLNSFRVWTDRVDAPLVVVKSCKKKLSELQSKYTDTEGMLDYQKMSLDEGWLAFKEATCELQKVDLLTMRDDLKIAFIINVYNMMIIFAFAELGIPSSNWMRLSFFDNVKVDIGGHLWSFNELESGVLRSNRHAPYHISRPIGASDPRLKAVLAEPEVRVHFALNCGAKSCPPVKNFTEEAIQEELRIVAQAFCEMSENVRLDTSSSGPTTLYVSKIFEWYQVDFGSNRMEMAQTLLQWLRGKQKEDLQAALDSGNLRVQSLPYDWSTNASQAHKFSGSPPRAEPGPAKAGCSACSVM